MNTSTSTKNFLAGLLSYAVMFSPVSALLVAPMPAMASGMFVTIDAISSAASTGGAFDNIAPATTQSSSPFVTTGSVSSATSAAASSNLTSTSSASSGSSTTFVTTAGVSNQITNAEASTSLVTTADVAAATKAADNKAALKTTADIINDTLAAEAAGKSSLITTGDVINLTKCAWDAGHTSLGYYIDGMFYTTGCATTTGGTTTTTFTPTITAGSDITVTKASATSTYTTTANITVNQNGSTSTVTVVCTPSSIDNQVVGSTTVSCVGNYASSTTNTVTYKYIVKDTTCTSNCGGGNGGATSTTPTITAGSDITVTKATATSTYLTSTNVTINLNGSTSTVTVVCTPGTIDNQVVGSTTVSCVGNYASSTTNTVAYKYTVNDTSTGCTSNCGGGSTPPINNGGGGNHGGGSSGGSTVIGSRANPTGEVLGLSTDDECSYLNEYLRLNNTNNPAEVLKLQAFLKVYEKADVNMTGFFDVKTDAAVRAFQVKYKADVLTPWGLKGSTGYVFYTTKKKINEIRCEHEFALSVEQKADISAYKLAMANFSNNSVRVAQSSITGTSGVTVAGANDSKATGSNTVANNSLQVGIKGAMGFWAKIKSGLFAALGMFTSNKEDKKSVDASAATSSMKNDDTKIGGTIEKVSVRDTKNIAGDSKGQKKTDTQVASAGASNNSLLSTFAALLAIAFGVLAFAMAAYLYRRTRVEEEAAEETTISA